MAIPCFQFLGVVFRCQLHNMVGSTDILMNYALSKPSIPELFPAPSFLQLLLRSPHLTLPCTGIYLPDIYPGCCSQAIHCRRLPVDSNPEDAHQPGGCLWTDETMQLAFQPIIVSQIEPVNSQHRQVPVPLLLVQYYIC